MKSNASTLVLGVLCALAAALPAAAAPAAYKIDPTHTFPSFEADHMGISTWRGKFNRSSGTLLFDKAAGSGSVDITIDMASIDFGQDQLNAWARGAALFHVKKFPKARFRGSFNVPAGGAPSLLPGELTLHGVTKPVVLTIHKLTCVPHPMFKRDLCGADASGSFDREAFGLGVGKEYGFDMKVDLRIQVEAVADK